MTFHAPRPIGKISRGNEPFRRARWLSHGGQQPIIGGRKPALSGKKLAFEGRKPAFRGKKLALRAR